MYTYKRLRNAFFVVRLIDIGGRHFKTYRYARRQISVRNTAFTAAAAQLLSVKKKQTEKRSNVNRLRDDDLTLRYTRARFVLSVHRRRVVITATLARESPLVHFRSLIKRPPGRLSPPRNRTHDAQYTTARSYLRL